MNAIKIGKFLASIRNEKRLTQEELAEKLYIDKRKISRWECGMSIPDLETVAKLCEILDVTPYEFITCKRLEKEKLTKKVINKFKSIKDFKKYKLKKKISTILSIILGVFFILTTIYTIKYYGKVEIYEFKSLDDNYDLSGAYAQTSTYSLYTINGISLNSNYRINADYFFDCKTEIYYNDLKLLEFNELNKRTNNKNVSAHELLYHGNISINQYANKNLTFKATCSNGYPDKQQYLINFTLIKKYDNRLF